MNFTAILAALAGIESVIKLVGLAKEALAQNGELTPQQEALLDAKILALTGPGKPDHWKTDRQLGSSSSSR